MTVKSTSPNPSSRDCSSASQAFSDSAAARSAGHSLLGSTGDLSAEQFLSSLRSLRFTGTLALSDAGGTMLLLLAKGQVEASFRLGAYDNLEAPSQGFHVYPHEPTDMPRLPGRDPNSVSPLLRALPRLTPPERLRPGVLHLGRLLDRLAEANFGGTLSYIDKGCPAVALLLDGTIRAAVHEVQGKLNSHADAMRALQRCEQVKSQGVVELEQLGDALMMPATAFAVEQSAQSSPHFSGLEVTPVGYRYWKAGQPFLLVPGQTHGPQRLYALGKDAVERTPEIVLPEEPPGWEDQAYQLTLRGRDALDSMMELAMEFRAEHGRQGQEILRTLGSGASLEMCALTLNMELGKLKPWLERFVNDGMLRKGRA